MRRTGIEFNRHDYEYDVYSLVKAFIPEEEVVSFYSGETPAGDFDRLFRVLYGDGGYTCIVEEQGGETLREQVELASPEDRFATKNLLKQTVYRMFSELTCRTLPWGTLTGIRPVKLAMHPLEKGQDRKEIAAGLRDTYFLSEEKTNLAIDIAVREREILRGMDYKNGYSLYVGIPFCPSICLYCSFGSHPMKKWRKRVDEYLDCLIREMAFTAEYFSDKKLQTVYIGGGTPTSLTASQLDRVLGEVATRFPMDEVREFTVEAGRPDTITEEKLAVIRRYPVSRISINPQTMNQETLDLVGRGHTVQEITGTFHMARGLGFDNINMDLIVGLPGEGQEEVAHTLEQIRELEPDSLTVHSLALKRAARLNLFRDRYREISFANSQEIMSLCEQTAAGMGMNPYYLYRQKNMAGNFENVGYAKAGKEGIYNILIMEEKQSIAALGAGSVSKRVYPDGLIKRSENVKDVSQYIARIEEMIERKKHLLCDC